MPRIVGVDIPENKKLPFALAYIKGIGRPAAEKIIAQLGLDPNMRASALTEDDVSRLTSVIDKEWVVEGELNRQIKDNIKRLADIGSYRGGRHKKGLPLRGQKTRSNGRTRKGPKRTVGGVSVRKAVSKT
ncbi:30S ribosomal protein S13 [candidate division WWE3 bacterium]|nr:30S ribosomal protein S13 [candidate division WWE3 bacterium]